MSKTRPAVRRVFEKQRNQTRNPSQKMNPPNSTSEYLFLFRGTDWDRSISATEMEQTMARFVAWFEKLGANGTMKAGQPLLHESRIVTGKNGCSVTDGPFAESKDAVGGYLIIHADSFDEAVDVARGCPMTEYGVAVEVRPLAAECPTTQRARRRMREEAQMATA
jgi:hypothetical protein